jgi:hypothetical protein
VSQLLAIGDDPKVRALLRRIPTGAGCLVREVVRAVVREAGCLVREAGCLVREAGCLVREGVP